LNEKTIGQKASSTWCAGWKKIQTGWDTRRLVGHACQDTVYSNPISKALCTMQSALIAGMNAKFHSSLTKIGQFTARHVGQHGDPLDKHTSLRLRDYTRNPWHACLDTTRPFLCWWFSSWEKSFRSNSSNFLFPVDAFVPIDFKVTEERGVVRETPPLCR
jgi:hypothetical protein